MGRIADLSDLGRSLVPYLIWSNSSTSLVLLQLAVVSGVLLAIVAPLIPWRYLFLIGGLSALLAGHPMAISLVKESTPYLRKTFQRYSRIVVLFLRDDALTDLELSSEIVELEKLELERATVEGFVMESFTGGELPKGFRWLAGEDWEIDHTGAWAAGVIDERVSSTTERAGLTSDSGMDVFVRGRNQGSIRDSECHPSHGPTPSTSLGASRSTDRSSLRNESVIHAVPNAHCSYSARDRSTSPLSVSLTCRIRSIASSLSSCVDSVPITPSVLPGSNAGTIDFGRTGSGTEQKTVMRYESSNGVGIVASCFDQVGTREAGRTRYKR